MTYQIRQAQRMVTFRTLAKVESRGLTSAQLLALNSGNLPSNIYNKYNQVYNSVTYAYAQARSRALKDTDKLLSSIPIDSGYIYVYKVLVDEGNTVPVKSIDSCKEQYNTFNKVVTGAYVAINKASKRNNSNRTIQVSNTATEHAFRDNFTSILLHNHSLIVSNYPVTAKELEQIVSNKLPRQFNIKVQEFNAYKSDEQLILNARNRNDPQVIKALNNYITYIYKTVAQKPFKTIYELTNFENLPLKKRYDLIRIQQLVTKGIRKHTSLTIHFPSTKKYISTKYLKYTPFRLLHFAQSYIVTYTKQPTYNLHTTLTIIIST